ncbi:hypothetical protein K7X08_028969 [Anisodus acutangulus]|uniref:Sialate O-acetylesterase domain-containing protein n=1 Tax=Anisodus acutangulus TaxID=402998 RepID=A0A9Q1L490_9SOLA|nr:hypothetical protein K7X08_028969 [Anisodus acutangulus]
MAGQGGVSYGYWDGIVPPECQSNPDVVSLSMSLHWKIAKEPLNYGVDCVRNCGIGPGMAFANAILKKDPNFGVIGLVPCSVSGKGIRRWSRGNSPYDQLLRKVKISLRDGGELRGLLWFHGESDTITKFDATHYKPRLQKFIQDLRTDLNSPLLPLLMVVLHVPRPWFKGKFADIVRQAQIEVELPNVVKVDAKGLPLNPDGIHLTTAAQIRVGNMLADAFLSSNITSPRKSSDKFHTTDAWPELILRVLVPLSFHCPVQCPILLNYFLLEDHNMYLWGCMYLLWMQGSTFIFIMTLQLAMRTVFWNVLSCLLLQDPLLEAFQLLQPLKTQPPLQRDLVATLES